MSFADAAVAFIEHYGYWALFILMALETAMIIHFVPSELIVTVAAATLARDGWSLAAVVLVSTLGASTGAFMLYGAARYGGRPFLLRYRRIFHLDEARLDRMEATFQRRAGAVMVFSFRMLPFLRAFVSIPAGLARMGSWKFLVLSTAGAAIFNLVLAWAGSRANKPDSLLARGLAAVHGFVAGHWLGLLAWSLVLLAILLSAWIGWRHRANLSQRQRARLAKAWELAAMAVVGLGIVLLVGALVAPSQVRTAIAWLQGGIAAAEGFDESSAWQVALVAAVEVLGVGIFLLALGRALRHAIRKWENRRDKPGPPE